jgi:hypothetical protein
MDHVQLRLDTPVRALPPKGEPPVVSVNLMLMWPSTASREEVVDTLEGMCENALAAYDRRQPREPVRPDRR